MKICIELHERSVVCSKQYKRKEQIIMDDTAVTVLLPFLGSAIGTLGGIAATAKLTNFRLEQLEKKVERHNNLVERIAVAERALYHTELRLNRLEQED